MARAYIKDFRIAFLSFPDLYSPIIKAWAENIPILGFLLGLSIVWQVLRLRHLPIESIVKNPVVPVLLVVILFGLNTPELIRTRYSHFLFPLLICIGLLSADQLGAILKRHHAAVRKFPTVMFAVCLLIFMVSEEFNLLHLMHLNSPDVAFRTNKYSRFSLHWYPRMDYRRPAELVNTEVSGAAKIIITGRALGAAAYMNNDFAVYWHRGGAAFPAISREGGTRELWSDRRLLSTNEEVIEHAKEADHVWLISYPGWDSLDPKALWRDRVQRIDIFKPGLDKRIEVWRIQLKNIKVAAN
jgi:hypothetical protein